MASSLNDILTQEPGYQYGTLWPVRYKLDAQGNPVHGSMGWAVPGLVSGAVNALSDLVRTPGEVVQGKVNPRDPEVGPRLAMEWGGLAAPEGALLAPRGSAGMFGSLFSATADKVAHKAAVAMERSGAEPEEIFNKTGWFRSGEGNWRYEIPDTQAKLKTGAFVSGDLDPGHLYLNSAMKPNGEPLRLPDVLEHDALYKAYPELRDVALHPTPGAEAKSYAGSYSPTTKMMSLSGGPAGGLQGTIHHEAQHAIDALEGFQAGAAPNDFLPSPVKRTLAEAPEMTRHWGDVLSTEGHDAGSVMSAAFKQRQGRKLTPEESEDLRAVAHEPWAGDFNSWMDQHAAALKASWTAADLYNRTGGEVMARNVEHRLPLWAEHGPLQKPHLWSEGYSQKYPWNTEDVARPNQIWNPQQFIATLGGK